MSRSTVSVLLNGQPVPNPLVIPADGITFKTLQITTSPAAPGSAFSIKTQAPLMLSVVNGSLDSNGQATVIVGPTRLRGDSPFTVSVVAASNQPNVAARFQ
jgi:hypothetical protein